MPQTPVHLDSGAACMYAQGPDVGPPPYESRLTGEGAFPHALINRHEGGVNCLVLDWSVRKIGLKEFWTLKWDRNYDTRGPWTKAGGVQPEDWPEWMAASRTIDRAKDDSPLHSGFLSFSCFTLSQVPQ